MLWLRLLWSHDVFYNIIFVAFIIGCEHIGWLMILKDLRSRQSTLSIFTSSTNHMVKINKTSSSNRFKRRACQFVYGWPLWGLNYVHMKTWKRSLHLYVRTLASTSHRVNAVLHKITFRTWRIYCALWCPLNQCAQLKHGSTKQNAHLVLELFMFHIFCSH